MEPNDGSLSHQDTSSSNNSDPFHHHHHQQQQHQGYSSGTTTRRYSGLVPTDATPHSSFSSSQEMVSSQRRSSIASTGTVTSSVSSQVAMLFQQQQIQLQQQQAQSQQPITTALTPTEKQDERRRHIKAIMKDQNLSQKEKSQKIQALMDGRGLMSQQQVTSTAIMQNGSSPTQQIIMNRRGSMSSYCSNASSVYASSMAQVAADAACETNIYCDNDHTNDNNNDISFHTNRSYSYSSSTNQNNHYNPDFDYVMHNSNTMPTTTDSGEQKLPTQNSENNNNTIMNMGSYKQYHGRSKSLQDWTDSDRINAAAHTTVFGANTNRIQQVSRLMEQSRPACEHYERNCTIISPCCGLAFGCRICHDECPVLPPPIVFHQRRLSANPTTTTAAVAGDTTTTNLATTHAAKDHSCCTHNHTASTKNTSHTYHVRNNDISSMTALADDTKPSPKVNDDHQHRDGNGMVHHTNKLERRRSLPVEFTTERKPEDNHHLIDRFRIREVICRHCYTRQGSKTNKCISCGIQFGQYHCNKCNLWMSDVESPYHCEDCGFCRVGGRDNFRHCNDCGMCIDTLLFNDHNCKSGKYMSDCPICQEDLFSSRFASHEMPCGHAIHWHCFTELTSYDTRCPVCKKTVESPERMEATWHAIAVGIALQPVPAEMARMVNILCNDCESTNYNQRWHFLGVRCPTCYSFNTTVEQIVMQGPDAATYLDRLDYVVNVSSSSPRMGDVPTDISLPTRFVAVQNDQRYDMNDDESSDDTMSEEDDMEE